MSAWICSDLHINTLAAYAARHAIKFVHKGEHISCALHPQSIATMLLAENYRSVNARYSETESATIAYVAEPELPDPYGMLKLVDCYDYQACECEDYDTTMACAFVKAVEAFIESTVSCPLKKGGDPIHTTVERMRKTPAYDGAPWGVD
jgi:hypothetical protein